MGGLARGAASSLVAQLLQAGGCSPGGCRARCRSVGAPDACIRFAAASWRCAGREAGAAACLRGVPACAGLAAGLDGAAAPPRLPRLLDAGLGPASSLASDGCAAAGSLKSLMVPPGGTYRRPSLAAATRASQPAPRRRKGR